MMVLLRGMVDRSRQTSVGGPLVVVRKRLKIVAMNSRIFYDGVDSILSWWMGKV